MSLFFVVLFTIVVVVLSFISMRRIIKKMVLDEFKRLERKNNVSDKVNPESVSDM